MENSARRCNGFWTFTFYFSKKSKKTKTHILAASTILGPGPLCRGFLKTEKTCIFALWKIRVLAGLAKIDKKNYRFPLFSTFFHFLIKILHFQSLPKTHQKHTFLKVVILTTFWTPSERTRLK